MPEDVAARFLVREREQLDQIASMLAERRNVVAFLVCEPALRPSVRSYLEHKSGVTIPEPAHLESPDAMLAALTRASEAEQPIESLVLATGAVDRLQTLNWHREKLRRGSSVLLWLEDLEGLRELRRWAPDAYSFSDMMVLAFGRRPPLVSSGDGETTELRLARLRFARAGSPAERAAAAATLANELRPLGVVDEIRRIAMSALDELPAGQPKDALALPRTALYMQLAEAEQQKLRLVAALRWTQRGLEEASRASDMETRQARLVLLARSRSPMGTDRRSTAAALEELERIGREAYPNVGYMVRSGAAENARRRGDLRHAEALLEKAVADPSVRGLNVAFAHSLRSRILLDAGRLADAEEEARAVLHLHGNQPLMSRISALPIAHCLSEQDELDAADEILNALSWGHLSYPFKFHAQALRGMIDMRRGQVNAALASLGTALHAAAEESCDGALFEITRALVSVARLASEAAVMTGNEAVASCQDLVDLGEETAISIAGADTPWYSILFLGLRGELLALDPSRIDEAILLTRAALVRARAAYPDAGPTHARQLVTLLLRAGRVTEAISAAADARTDAALQRDLHALAGLQALTVAAMACSSAPASDIEAGMTALRSTVESTGAPRIHAEALLDLALHLPPDAHAPDSMELLREAHALFLEMPMPAQCGCCLERMAEVLLARCRPAEARDSYLSARSIYERYGLGLRLPLVNARLAALPP